MEGYGIDVNQKKWVGEPSPDPPGYVSTPKGKLLKWDPVDKISYLLSDKMPQDPKTVGKGERYIRTYKHSKGSTSESRRKSWYQEKYKESIINKIKSIFIEGK